MACAGLITAAFTGRSTGQAAPPNPGQPRIGEFTISNFVVFDFLAENSSTIRADLSGPNLVIRSTQYEMAAPRIQMTARKSGAPVRYKVTKANATGGTRIVVRQPEAQRTNVVTCDNAFYAGAANPPAAGRIDLKGNVRWVVQDPALAEPWVQTAESGFIELLGPNTTRIVLSNGSGAGVLREPAPKVKPR
jgi:hypothetical protein